MSDNLKAGIRFTPDIYAEIGYDSQNETGEMSVIGANGETIWESGEGGGSSDFTTVKMRVTGAEGAIKCIFPFFVEESGNLLLAAIPQTLDANAEIDILIPEGGKSLGSITPIGGNDFLIDGGIQHMGSDRFGITGDCTITLSESPT